MSFDEAQSVIGDVNDVNNILGCIVWSFVLLAVLVFGHLALVQIARSGAQNGYSVPHRFAIGNWESRALNLLCFPLAVASTLAVLHPHTQSSTMAVLGAGTLMGLSVWICMVFFRIASAVNNGEVAWVWEHSVRESGPSRKEEQQGYWCDVECDQLLTQPVSRAILGELFEYRWVNTVGDIIPTNIYTTAIPNADGNGAGDAHGAAARRRGRGRGGTSSSSGSGASASSTANGSSQQSFGSLMSAVLRPVQKLERGGHNTANYLLAKNPQVVMVNQGRKFCSSYKGGRLMAGVLRTKWLDIMWTLEGLSKFLDPENSRRRAHYVPLLVKTNQLSGPITNGANAFFFDGVRIPFVRIAETIWKMAIGVCLGVAAAASIKHSDSSIPTAAYGAICGLSFCMVAYVLATKPYTRRIDNCMVAGIAALIGSSAGAMLGYEYNQKSSFADLFLSLSAAAAVALSVYALYIISSVFTALCCPPLDESRFLNNLANCSVFVNTDLQKDGDSEEDEYQMPAYTKYAARDIAAKSTSGRAQIHKFGTFEDLDLHFEHEEIVQACSSGVLPIP